MNMKTNVIVESKNDRELFGTIIRQETKTGFLCLSDLGEAYTRARVLNNWGSNKGHPTDIINSKENTERIYYLLAERGLINTGFSVFVETEKDCLKIKIKTTKEN